MASSTSTTQRDQTPLSPEQKAKRQARRRAGKLIGFSTWRQEWRASNPEASKDQMQEAWAEAKKDVIGRATRAVRNLEKKGLRIVPLEADAAADA